MKKRTGYTSLPEGCNVPEFSKNTEHKRTQLRWAVSGNLSNALLYEINDMTAAAKSHSINSSTWQKAYFFNIFKTRDRQSSLSYWRLDLALWTWTHWTVSPLHSKLLVIGTVRGQQTLDSSVLLFSSTSKVLHLNKSLLRSRRNLILTYALSQTSYDILGKYMCSNFGWDTAPIKGVDRKQYMPRPCRRLVPSSAAQPAVLLYLCYTNTSCKV